MRRNDYQGTIVLLVVITETLQSGIIDHHLVIDLLEHFREEPPKPPDHWHRVVREHHLTNLNSLALHLLLQLLVVDGTSTQLLRLLLDQHLYHAWHLLTVHHQRNQFNIWLRLECEALLAHPINITKVCWFVSHQQDIIALLLDEGRFYVFFQDVQPQSMIEVH